MSTDEEDRKRFDCLMQYFSKQKKKPLALLCSALVSGICKMSSKSHYDTDSVDDMLQAMNQLAKDIMSGSTKTLTVNIIEDLKEEK